MYFHENWGWGGSLIRAQRPVGTLQDVHPDQLGSLWATADLVFEEILRLDRGKEKKKGNSFFFSHSLILQQQMDE